MTENCIMNKPCQQFNCDETDVPLAPSSPKVVTLKGDKYPYAYLYTLVIRKAIEVQKEQQQKTQC